MLAGAGQVRGWVSKQGGETGEKRPTPCSAWLPWDHPLILFGEWRPRRVGWGEGQALWECALLFCFVLLCFAGTFFLKISLDLVLNISSQHSCGFLFTSTWCWLFVFSHGLRPWTRLCGISLLFKLSWFRFLVFLNKHILEGGFWNLF